jgi:cyclophilin family peptidyl-prolyl cis-trans isomerase
LTRQSGTRPSTREWRPASARLAALVLATAGVWSAIGDRSVSAQRSAPPTVIVETSRGTFSFETFPDNAPYTVAHVLRLVRGGFYDGMRIHRALPGFLVQFGDPQSRDLSLRPLWGRGAAAGSGIPVDAAEISPKRLHRKGAVGMAHLGDPSKAESQIYVMLADKPELDGRYAIFGQVTGGEAVPGRLQVGDSITRVYVRP